MWSCKSGSLIVWSQYLQFTDWTILWNFHKWRWRYFFRVKHLVQNPHENTMTADYVMKKSFLNSSSYSHLMKHKSPLVICSLLIGQYGINWYKIRDSESLYFNNLWISFYRHLCRNWCVIFVWHRMIFDIWSSLEKTPQRLLMTMDNHISLIANVAVDTLYNW